MQILMQILKALTSFLGVLRFSLFPKSDSRRDLSSSEAALQESILCKASSDSIIHKVPLAVHKSKEELMFIELHFNDCVSHIKEYQKSHWIVFVWLIAAQVGFAWVILEMGNAGTGATLILKNYSPGVPFIVGLFGLIFLNEISIALERNRKHLDTLRILMGGFIVDMYVDIDSNKHNVGRHSDKRRGEIVRHFLLVFVSLVSALILLCGISDSTDSYGVDPLPQTRSQKTRWI